MNYGTVKFGVCMIQYKINVIQVDAQQTDKRFPVHIH